MHAMHVKATDVLMDARMDGLNVIRTTDSVLRKRRVATMRDVALGIGQRVRNPVPYPRSIARSNATSLMRLTRARNGSDRSDANLSYCAGFQ